MRPKEYYDKFTIAEDSRYIFTLLPSEFEEHYKKHIKEPIESIKLEEGKITCESYIDFANGVDHLDEIWKSIQKASIIIANISGFKPSVMLELGVALMKKEKVILIAEKTLNEKVNLPFNIHNLGVQFYDPSQLAGLSEFLKHHVDKLIVINKPKIRDPRVQALMNSALRQRKEMEFESAIVLFEKMNQIEPNNWYIYKEWGITFQLHNNYKDANIKMQQALEFAERDREKSEIYIELAKMSMNNNMEDAALQYFEKAENLERDNDSLYEKWAFLYYRMGKFQDAMNKMMLAVKLAPNSKYHRWKFEFYAKKFADPSFRIDLKTYLRQMEEDEKRNTLQSTPGTESKSEASSQQSPEFRPYAQNNPEAFRRFKSRHRPKEEMEGVIAMVDSRGVFVALDFNAFGLIHSYKLPNNYDLNEKYKKGNRIRVKYQSYNDERLQLGLETVADSYSGGKDE